MLLAAFADIVSPYPPLEANFEAMLQPPNAQYWFGTDHFGRDMFSMIMVGARTSIAVALVAVGIGMALGVLIASVWRAELPVLHFALSAIYPNILLSGQ